MAKKTDPVSILLSLLYGGLLSSLWWLAAKYGYNDYRALWIPPAILSATPLFAIFVVLVDYYKPE